MKQVRFIRISFFLCALFALISFWAGFYFGNTRMNAENMITRNTADFNTEERIESGALRSPKGIVTPEETVESMTALSPDKYCLKNSDDYLVVYKGDSTDIYFETDLKLSDLPDALQRKVKSGLEFDSLQDLYSFLENYSS